MIIYWIFSWFSNISYVLATDSWDPNDLWSVKFELDVNDLSPSTNKYTAWPKDNVKGLLRKVSDFLLIVIPVIAVLFIVIAGIKIITAWWDTSKVTSAKTIISFNIIAIVLALFSYSIIQLIAYLLGSTV